jgi:signal transduction histidine kinase
VALAMLLGRAKRKYDSDPEATRALLEEAHRGAKEAIVELRELTRGLSPPVLADRGLDAALSALAARSQVPVSIDFAMERRPGRTAESIAYFMIAESLTNIVKHARASRAWVVVRRAGALLRVEVGDDGVGGAALAGGTGLAGLADRAAGVDGTLTVTSPAGGPTTVSLELPCES